VLAASMGCAPGARTSSQPAPPTGWGGGPLERSPLEASPSAITLAAAVDALAVEACARVESCDGLALGRRFLDVASCREGTARELRRTLDTEVCPTGWIDGDAFRQCAEAIRRAPCRDDADLATTTCRPDTMCAP
jgi:hypothetical protein